jgi:hypothetical protein
MKPKSLFIALLLVCAALLQNSQAVLAHETITVGDYEIEVGWLNEPPIAGQMNSIVIDVTNTGIGTHQPVEDVSSLTLTLSYGGQEKALALEPLGEETPGQFAAAILPTVPGEYEVIFGGTLGGHTVDAETHVEEVQPADVMAFPSVDSATSSGSDANWLVWLSLLIGLIGVGLGITALRKGSMR